MVQVERGFGDMISKPRSEWKLSEAAEAIGARWSGNDTVFSPQIRIDSREISHGDIFWALPGERTDGHAHIENAIERGAKALVINPQLAGEALQTVLQQGIPAILVKDTLEALRDLSIIRRGMLDPVVIIGITGTVGKTTTREMIRSVVSYLDGVHCARRSFNTWIGCALTVLESPLDTRILILEMGTNRPGEIKEMAKMFRPNYGIITEIGAGHLEGLNDEKGVLDEKMELANCDSLKFLSYNFDNVPLRNAVEDLTDDIERISVGRSDSLYCIEESKFNFNSKGPSLSLTIRTPCGKRSLESRLFGEQNAYAAAFAMAAGDFLDVPEAYQRQALESFEALQGRGGVRTSPGGIHLIDETYNANPLSMKQAILTLAAIVTDSKRFAVLGGMGELGDHSSKFHMDMSEYFNALEGVFLLGKTWNEAFGGEVPSECRIFNDIEELNKALKESVSPGDIVLFKGSRIYGMERSLKYLEGT